MALDEQLAYVKIRICQNSHMSKFVLGVSPADIKADLDKVYGDQSVSYATITRWCVRFKQGRESLEDDPRSGRPLSAFTENDVTAVKNLIDEDARYTIEKISETLNINSGAVFCHFKTTS